MQKRKKVLIAASTLSAGFIGIQLLEGPSRIWSIVVLALASVLAYAWVLREGIGRDMTLLTLILPFFYTLGVGFFWFLLPASVFARIPVAVLYGVGIYALVLTANIYTVGAIKTIALLRAARGVGFVLTLLTSFLIFDAIMSLKPGVLLMSALIIPATFLLLLQGYWSVGLDKEFSKLLVALSLMGTLTVLELSVALFFWPVTVVVGSLFLTSSVYILLGLGQAKLESRLFSSTIREYMTVGVLVFLGMLIATKWGS